MSEEMKTVEWIGTKEEPVTVSAEEILEAIAKGKSIKIQYAFIEGDLKREKIKDRLDKDEKGRFIVRGDISIQSCEVRGCAIFVRGANFDCNMNFRNTTFNKLADFNYTIFNNVYFINNKFSEGADFRNSAFTDRASFKNSTLNNVYFGNAEFMKDADFSGSTFSGAIEFSKTSFNNAYFTDSSFSGNINFSEVTFSGKADFNKVTFIKNVYFKNATFSKNTSFDNTAFNDDVDFRGATFCGDTNFSEATFSGETDFRNATFSEDVEFIETTFNGDAVFIEATFSKYVYFITATFGKDATFRHATFSENADFSDAKMKYPANFAGVNYKENTVLVGLWNNILQPLLFPIIWILTIGKVKLPKKVITEFSNFNTETIMDGSSNPYLKRYIDDEEWIASWRSRSRWRKFLFVIWELTSHCGRSIRLWAFWSLLIAFFFGWVYMTHPCWFKQDMGTLSPWYFSIVTFTTLGFGDLTPKAECWQGQAWVMAEVIIGYIMLGGLISIFANKFARRS